MSDCQTFMASNSLFFYCTVLVLRNFRHAYPNSGKTTPLKCSLAARQLYIQKGGGNFEE
jgi:hypothetical protein